MKALKLILLTSSIVLFAALNTASAQKSKQPLWEARMGVGLLPTFVKDLAKSEQAPLSLELKYRPSRKFSLGLLAGSSISQTYQKHHTGEERIVKNNFKMLALRGAAHVSHFKRWDAYGGILLGYTNNDVEYTYLDEDKEDEPSFSPTPKKRNGLFFSAFVGTSYKVYKNINVFGELSYGLSIATTGVSVKF